MKRLLIFTLIAALALSGCTHNRPATEPEPTIIPETTGVIASAAVTETEESAPEEAKSFSQPVNSSVAVETIYSETTISDEIGVAEGSTHSDTTVPENSSETVDSTYSGTTISDGTQPPVEAEQQETAPPATTEPAEEIETAPPTESPDQVPSVAEPEETLPSQPVEETEPEPEFEISYWISFARDYAQSIGLNLDAAAVDCWDNPITAGAHCIYLERDITNRLNRYSADEDITDVWIWAVDLGNGSYDLYIGYA